jgi:hypothetical protein
MIRPAGIHQDRSYAVLSMSAAFGMLGSLLRFPGSPQCRTAINKNIQ